MVQISLLAEWPVIQTMIWIPAHVLCPVIWIMDFYVIWLKY